MKMSNFSIAGIAFGLLFAVFSAIRYYMLYPDVDKAIAYCLIGAIIIIISYMYNTQLKMGKDIEAIENYISDREDEQKK